jgi:hypothetical protein
VAAICARLEALLPLGAACAGPQVRIRPTKIRCIAKLGKRLNNVKPTQIDQLNDVSGFPHPVLSVSQSGSQLCKPLKSQAQHKRVRFAISVLLQWFPKRVLKITKVVLL